MKIKLVEKIVETEVYVADDGTEFEWSDACLDYEMTKKEDSMEFYDYDYNRIDFDGFVYVNIKNQQDMDCFCELCDYYGLNLKKHVTGPGVWMCDHNGMINISEAVSFITSK